MYSLFNYENEIMPLVGNVEQCIEYFREKGILKRYLYCSGCSILLSLTKYKRRIDGYAFKCNVRK